MGERSFEGLPDFQFRGHGTVSLLTPQTPMALRWVEQHIDQGGEVTWFGPALVIEHRYVPDVLHDIHEGGLTVDAPLAP